jgi:glycosyltransferase involved in cell wall biosynthesis
LRWWLIGVARFTSSLNIYVSDAHRAALPIPGVPARRVYNALAAEFAERATRAQYCSRQDGGFVLLMVASLRDYKGVPELLSLCERLIGRGDLRFELVVNDDAPAIDRYFEARRLPGNLRVHPRIADTAPFYAAASVLLNLSRVDQWVETFGLTILEAMAYGLPVIVPPVGGPTELVEDGVEGYRVDSRDVALLERRVLELADDPGLCNRMSAAARERASQFSEADFARGIRGAVEAVLTE